MDSNTLKFVASWSSTRILRFMVIFLIIACSLLSFEFYQRSLIQNACRNCTQNKIIIAEFNIGLQAPNGNPNQTEILVESVKFLNELGSAMGVSGGGETIQSFENVSRDVENIRAPLAKNDLGKMNKTKIVVGIIVCGRRRAESMVMLKSVVMFSMDAQLHLVVFSDSKTILKIGRDVLLFKLGLEEMGYFGFTFELHLESYPKDPGGPKWKYMYATCATQRLFLPSLLKHHDAMIYLDTDVLVLSNLTETWEIFQKKMKNTKMLGVTPNSESASIYYPDAALPYIGKHGVNAGVMLLNLTQMREFNFEARAKSIYTAYDTKIMMADQDIINAMFHPFQEKILDISCAFNFYWIHCYIDGLQCYEKNRTKNVCFCHETLKIGVRILHGNCGSFTSDFKEYPFIRNTYKAFKNLDMFKGSYLSMFTALQDKFKAHKPAPCPPMTADVLYGNAVQYLKNLKLK